GGSWRLRLAGGREVGAPAAPPTGAYLLPVPAVLIDCGHARRPSPFSPRRRPAGTAGAGGPVSRRPLVAAQFPSAPGQSEIPPAGAGGGRASAGLLPAAAAPGQRLGPAVLDRGGSRRARLLPGTPAAGLCRKTGKGRPPGRSAPGSARGQRRRHRPLRRGRLSPPGGAAGLLPGRRQRLALRPALAGAMTLGLRPGPGGAC